MVRCRELAPLLGPDQGFSHETAAAIWGIELPSALAEGPLHVSSRHPRMAPRRRGVHGHRSSSPVTRLVVVADLPVVDIVTVWTQLAAALSVDDLVAVGDQLVLDPVVLDPRRIRPYATIEQLRERLEGFSGRGAASLSRHCPSSAPEPNPDRRRCSGSCFCTQACPSRRSTGISVRRMGPSWAVPTLPIRRSRSSSNTTETTIARASDNMTPISRASIASWLRGGS